MASKVLVMLTPYLKTQVIVEERTRNRKKAFCKSSFQEINLRLRKLLTKYLLYYSIPQPARVWPGSTNVYAATVIKSILGYYDLQN